MLTVLAFLVIKLLFNVSRYFYAMYAMCTIIIIIIFRLRNDLYCVEWGVKLYSLTHHHQTPWDQRPLVSMARFTRILHPAVYDVYHK